MVLFSCLASSETVSSRDGRRGHLGHQENRQLSRWLREICPGHPISSSNVPTKLVSNAKRRSAEMHARFENPAHAPNIARLGAQLVFLLGQENSKLGTGSQDGKTTRSDPRFLLGVKMA